MPLHEGGTGAQAYADAVATYLGFAVTNITDRNAAIVGWANNREHARNVFSRQAISMSWDYCETNVIETGSGSFFAGVEKIEAALKGLSAVGAAVIQTLDAQSLNLTEKAVISTDPPYYDNIQYADLSDFFYVWLRRSISSVWPSNFRRLTTPKDNELVAAPYRIGSTEAADQFFMEQMGLALKGMARSSRTDTPLAIYYAFKQAEVAASGMFSAGWASFLQGVVDSGWSIDGTWPVRTELERRLVGNNANMLASSIVLVCRTRSTDADVITRADFIRTLKREMPVAIDAIRKAGVGPVDMQQSVIGPGMGVFSRYAKVLEDDDGAMSVKTALALINRVWEEIENELDQAFDAETQVALAWFATYGFDARASGELITLTTAKNTSDRALFASGVFKDMKGKAGLTPREELPPGWSPSGDKTLTTWECVQHTARVLNAPDGGGEAAAALVAQMGPKAEEARALAYRLFEIATNKGWAAEALVYNELAQEWTKLEDAAATLDAAGRAPLSGQSAFDFEGTA